MCHSNIADLPCHSRIILFLFDLTDCSIGKTFFSISFPHLLRNIERFSERTLQICRAVFLLPARSEHISQTRKSQPAEHLFLMHSTKKCTPARYFLVHQYAKTVFQWHPLEVGVFLLEEDTTKKSCLVLYRTGFFLEEQHHQSQRAQQDSGYAVQHFYVCAVRPFCSNLCEHQCADHTGNHNRKIRFSADIEM